MSPSAAAAAAAAETAEGDSATLTDWLRKFDPENANGPPLDETLLKSTNVLCASAKKTSGRTTDGRTRATLWRWRLDRLLRRPSDGWSPGIDADRRCRLAAGGICVGLTVWQAMQADRLSQAFADRISTLHGAHASRNDETVWDVGKKNGLPSELENDGVSAERKQTSRSNKIINHSSNRACSHMLLTGLMQFTVRKYRKLFDSKSNVTTPATATTFSNWAPTAVSYSPHLMFTLQIHQAQPVIKNLLPFQL